MTLNKLLELASWGTHVHYDATAEDWAEIRRFARTWKDLAGHELEDIRISEKIRDVVEVVRCKDCINNDHGRCSNFDYFKVIDMGFCDGGIKR